MKKLFKHLLAVICIALSLASCEQSSIEEPNLTNEKIENISFKYNGKTYSCEYQTNGKMIIYNNKEVQEIFEELSNNPNLATFIGDDQTIQYFDTYEDLERELNIQRVQDVYSNLEKNANTKALFNASVNISLYINVKYKGGGKSFRFNSPSPQPGASFTDLSTIGLLNKISSLKINLSEHTAIPGSASVTLWDQKTYQGRSVTWVAGYGKNDINIPNLYNVTRGHMMENLHWNDAAQSISMGFVRSL